ISGEAMRFPIQIVALHPARPQLRPGPARARLRTRARRRRPVAALCRTAAQSRSAAALSRQPCGRGPRRARQPAWLGLLQLTPIAAGHLRYVTEYRGAMTNGRKAWGDHALTGAERQALHRARHAAAPVTRYRPPADRRS